VFSTYFQLGSLGTLRSSWHNPWMCIFGKARLGSTQSTSLLENVRAEHQRSMKLCIFRKAMRVDHPCSSLQPGAVLRHTITHVFRHLHSELACTVPVHSPGNGSATVTCHSHCLLVATDELGDRDRCAKVRAYSSNGRLIVIPRDGGCGRRCASQDPGLNSTVAP
jgi:hypothetical protein